MKSYKLKKNFTFNYKLILLIVMLVLLLIIYLICIKKNNKKVLVEKFENNDGINSADKILFINLDNRKDRLESITNQFKNQNINMDKVHRITAHYTPGNGHYGCAKSHLDAIKYAQENDFKNVIVFEDDFKFTTTPEKTKEMFNNLFNNLNESEWDVILFTEMYAKKENTKYSFLNKITEAQTSSGYIVNKNYYPKLIEVFQKCVDNMTQEKTTGVNWEQWALDQAWKVNQKEDRWFVFNPLMGEQDKELISTIETITNYNNKK